MHMGECVTLEMFEFGEQRPIAVAAPLRNDAVLDAHGVIRSMSRKGNCWDNAPSESFFGTLKQELILGSPYLCRDGTRTLVFEYLEVYYNPKRRHSTLGFLSPNDYEQRTPIANSSM